MKRNDMMKKNGFQLWRVIAGCIIVTFSHNEN